MEFPVAPPPSRYLIASLLRSPYHEGAAPISITATPSGLRLTGPDRGDRVGQPNPSANR
jgi:hypothetical protein